MRPKVEIVCHKGANKYAPENTFASTRLCIDWGMDYVEIDVNTSKDGVLYLFHGPDVSKTTNGKGLIHELLFEEIDRLDAGSWFSPEFAGEPVPRLEPFLRWIKDKVNVFFDVKEPVEPLSVIEMVYKFGLEEDCFFWFESPAAAVRFRKLDQKLPLKVNISKTMHVAQAAEEFRADIVEVGLDQMSQELLDACRRHGVKVMINYLRNEPEAFRKILRWGVDMVNVDHGDTFARVAKEFYANEERLT